MVHRNMICHLKPQLRCQYLHVGEKKIYLHKNVSHSDTDYWTCQWEGRRNNVHETKEEVQHAASNSRGEGRYIGYTADRLVTCTVVRKGGLYIDDRLVIGSGKERRPIY